MKQELLGKRVLTSTRCFDLLQQNAFKVDSGYKLACWNYSTLGPEKKYDPGLMLNSLRRDTFYFAL